MFSDQSEKRKTKTDVACFYDFYDFLSHSLFSSTPHLKTRHSVEKKIAKIMKKQPNTFLDTCVEQEIIGEPNTSLDTCVEQEIIGETAGQLDTCIEFHII
jgi:hypothetical protein